MISWKSSQKYVVNVLATEIMKKTTNAIVLYLLFSCSLIFVALYSLKILRFLNILWIPSQPFTS